MSKRSDRPEGLYLGADDLQVGQFVRLETGWTNHPFPFNNFRVKDERQLRQLKALGLDRFLVDPARSDAAVRSETMAAARSLMLVQAEAAARLPGFHMRDPADRNLAVSLDAMEQDS